MADDNKTPETTPAATPATDTPAPTTPPEAAIKQPEPQTPAPIAHDPNLLELARDVGIEADVAGAMSPAELGRSVKLLVKQRMALGQPAVKPDQPAAPVPEPDFALPEALKAKLNEFDPAIAEAVEYAARAGTERAKKAEEALAKVRQEVTQQETTRRIQAAMTPIPEAQRLFVWNKMVELDQMGAFPAGTSHEAAVAIAHKAVLQAFGITPGTPAPASPPPPPGAPAPTPTARPTNRISDVADSGKDPIDLLREITHAKMRQWEEEDERDASKNGRFASSGP